MERGVRGREQWRMALMPLQTRLTDLLMGCYMQIALELKGRFNYTTRSNIDVPCYEKCKTKNFLHTPPSNTLYHVGCPSLPSHNIQGASSLHPSLPRTLVAPPSRRSRVCLSHLAASIQSSRVQTRRERGNQSGIIGDAALSTANERPVNHRSVRASEKKAQAEVNPLSSSSITVATCECLLILRSLRPLRPLALPAVPLIPVRPLVAWLPEIAVSDARSRNSVRALGLRLSTLVDVFRVQCGCSLSSSKLKYAPQRGNSVIGWMTRCEQASACVASVFCVTAAIR